MTELADIINDVPAELLAGEEAAGDDTSLEDEEQQNDDGDQADDQTDANAGEGGDDTDDETEDEGDDDYFTGLDETDDKPPAPPEPPAPGLTDEGQYILSKLPKIAVNIVMPTADGKGEEIRQYQVYGWGDLPRDMKGFVTPYEQGLFSNNAQNNELKARDLQRDFQTERARGDADAYVKRENKMIADDLTELRQEGTFPKFKGVPGSKEFNDSPGGKEFDRVVAFMDEQNIRYGKAAQQGRAFRHIGFREAFIMLNGPNIKKAQQQDMSSRRQAAAKLKGGRGTSSGDKVVATKRVDNITDLADEFASFAGRAS